jgi:hypothetical protein
MIRMWLVGHKDGNRNAYCTVVRNPEGKPSIHVRIILK